jgi:hypothetical protein
MKKDIYTNCVLLSLGCKVFLDDGGEIIAPAGKYSDGFVCYTVNAFGTITELNQCGGTTSTTTTSTSTTSTSTSTTTLSPLAMEYLIVAGGGSGGGSQFWVWPGGGGGGRVITGSMIVNSPLTIGVGEGGQNIFYQNNPNLNPKSTLNLPYPCDVSFFSGSHGSKGFPSYISGSGIYQLADGGGQGGTFNDFNSAQYPIPFYAGIATLGGLHSNGGNGGGAAIVSASSPSTYQIVSGGLSTGGGFNGAWSTGSATLALNNAGGGAGAGANGSGANGGNGLQWLDGNYYAGGGGGLNTYTSSTARGTTGIPGLGGGGGFDTDGAAHTGGGGGGSWSAFYPANGGKGVVKIRYIGTPRATGGTITQSGGYTYHTFTSSLGGGAYIVDAVSGSNGITCGYYGYDKQYFDLTGQWKSAFTASFIPNS